MPEASGSADRVKTSRSADSRTRRGPLFLVILIVTAFVFSAIGGEQLRETSRTDLPSLVKSDLEAGEVARLWTRFDEDYRRVRNVTSLQDQLRRDAVVGVPITSASPLSGQREYTHTFIVITKSGPSYRFYARPGPWQNPLLLFSSRWELVAAEPAAKPIRNLD